MKGKEKETHVVDLVEGDVSGVLDVLLLLSVPGGFCKSVPVQLIFMMVEYG
jgi:hypothetical protein